MNENVKAIIVLAPLILLVGALFWTRFPRSIFLRWTLAIGVISIVGFLGNLWVVAVAVILLSMTVPTTGGQRVAWYLVLLPTLPAQLHHELVGLIPGVRYLTNINHPRICICVLLLPLLIPSLVRGAVAALRKPAWPAITDVCVLTFVSVISVLSFRETTFTNGLREAFGYVLDILLPYYIISRNVRSVEDFRLVAWALVLSAFIQGCVGVFEGAKSWLLYHSLAHAWGIPVKGGGGMMYMSRLGILRVVGSSGQPIAFGYFMVVGLSALAFLWDRVRKQQTAFVLLVALVMLTTLFFAGSKGPWVEGAALALVWYVLRPGIGSKVVLVTSITAVLLLGATSLSDVDPKALYKQITRELQKHMDAQSVYNIEYRKELISSSLQVIKKNYLLGTPDYLEIEPLADMVQGQGIIDVTNSYVQQALAFGVVGLGLFVSVFLSSALSMVSLLGALNRHSLVAEMRLGQFLVSLIVAIMLVIGTVSSITYIPHYYYAIIGLGAACTRMSRERLRTVRSPGRGSGERGVLLEGLGPQPLPVPAGG